MEPNEEILSRLKFIGYIEKGEKINVKFVHRQPNNWITKLSRSLLYPDNRSSSLKFLKEVLNRSFEILEKKIEKEEEYIARNIYRDLVASKEGLLNLKHTYIEDSKFCCDLDVLIETTMARIEKIREENTELFNGNEETKEEM